MDKKYQVFVSSTFEDLKEERAAVELALIKDGFLPVGMEYFSASNRTQWEVIESLIPQCDYYVVIVAGKYGSIEEASQISYTQKEYELALRCGVPCLGFIFRDIDNLPFIKVEADQVKREKLLAFREIVKSRMCSFWTNKDELASAVLTALHHQIINNPRIGWIRANQTDNPEVTHNTINEKHAFGRELSQPWPSSCQAARKSLVKANSRRVFIVHGHNKEVRNEVELFVHSIGYEPVVLFKQPNLGATIIEKFEREARDICFAIVIYSACDEGRGKGDADLKPRARQNVVFEHGYMCSVLGRDKVCALLEQDVERPSDISGVVYTLIDENGLWKHSIAREMVASGLDVNMNKLVL